MKKKIYFAGSIRGGRNFADLYRKMIEHMQLTDIVLTEHIGQADINLMEKGRMSECWNLQPGHSMASGERHGGSRVQQSFTWCGL